MMPGMDGFEVCRRLRGKKSTRALPVIMITAYDKESVKKIEALDTGADDFIRKPFDRYELLARVRSLLRMKRLYDELGKAKQRLEDELAMAREVQQAFLPREYPNISGLEFYHRYVPTFAVGGDFFDVKELSPGVIEIFISDVMGHGPQAAMITGVIKTLLTYLSSSLASPGYLLSQLNDQFHDLMASGELSIFVTAFCMMIDMNKGTYTCSNAGHTNPILVQGDGAAPEDLVVESGTALGMVPNILYKDCERKLVDNSMFFFFTDGLSELMNRDREQFGAGKLQEAVLNNTHLPPHSFVEAIMSAADAFCKGLSSQDDMTLLAVSYTSRR